MTGYYSAKAPLVFSSSTIFSAGFLFVEISLLHLKRGFYLHSFGFYDRKNWAYFSWHPWRHQCSASRRVGSRWLLTRRCQVTPWRPAGNWKPQRKQAAEGNQLEAEATCYRHERMLMTSSFVFARSVTFFRSLVLSVILCGFLLQILRPALTTYKQAGLQKPPKGLLTSCLCFTAATSVPLT